VGLRTDRMINHYRSLNYPIISLHERVLMVLVSWYTDDIIIGATYLITSDLIKSLNIELVVDAIAKDEALENR
jgi:ethanolamine-phosphate cytidylyltransferase